ncbi:Uncharacterised protein [Mycobacteroides abscessus subsp. abscessus]|nr:Uncharacterised protein [Mycobacteroides abscessus subsp. abscessus]
MSTWPRWRAVSSSTCTSTQNISTCWPRSPHHGTWPVAASPRRRTLASSRSQAVRYSPMMSVTDSSAVAYMSALGSSESFHGIGKAGESPKQTLR